MNTSKILAGFFLMASLFAVTPAMADTHGGLSKGQIIYVPAYSHIYSVDSKKPFMLTVTLSIRNIDPLHTIGISIVDFFSSQGKLRTQFIETPILLKPFASERFIVPMKERGAGSGAHFLVHWQSDAYVNPPITESIMIGTQAQQGLSFTSRGVPILDSKVHSLPKDRKAQSGAKRK